MREHLTVGGFTNAPVAAAAESAGSSPQHITETAIDVMEVIRKLWTRRLWILGFTLAVTLIGVVYTLSLEPVYRAEVVMLARDGQSGGGLSSRLAQLGGLADVAGISLSPSNRQEPLGILRSRGFAQRFIAENGLLPVLAFPVERDQRRAAPAVASAGVDYRRAVERFTRSVMSVAEDRRTGLVTIRVDWSDPAVAADWANRLAAQLNREMQGRVLRDSQRNVDYLREQLETNESLTLQQSVARLMESEMQKAMLARGADEYAYRIIDSAEVPIHRFKPKRTVMVVLFCVIGLLMSIAGALLVDPVRVMHSRLTSQ